MTTIYMEGWDYIQPNAATNQYQPLLYALGYQGNGMNTGGFYPVVGAFGIGTAMQLESPPGGINVFVPLDGNESGPDGFIWSFRAKLDAQSSNKKMYLRNSQLEADVFRIEYPGPGAAGIIRFIGAFGTVRTRTGLIKPDTWFFVQIKWVPGLFEVLVNGDIVASVTSAGIPPTFDTWRVTSDFAGTGQLLTLDDMRIDTCEGPTNNDYLGNLRIGAQLPVGEGDVTMLTPFGGSFNWQIAANTVLSTARYNYTPDVGDYDLYDMNPNVAARQIYALNVRGMYYQDDGIQLHGQNVIKTGGIEHEGSPLGLNQQNFGSISDYWDRNPNTNDYWTQAELNEPIQAGPKLASSD